MSELQQTEQWLRDRCGKFTASRAHEIMAKMKNGAPSAMRANYLADLVCQRITGEPGTSFVTPEMQYGIDTEEEACATYCLEKSVTVVQVGFVPHPRIRMSGCSPDGLIGAAGLVEFKCPNKATHIAQLLDPSNIGRRYTLQIQWQLACTERMWCDFVSFDKRFTPAKRLAIWRVHRDEKEIALLEAEAVKFLDEVDRVRGKLDILYPEQEAAA